jgi:hypothetical protein
MNQRVMNDEQNPIIMKRIFFTFLLMVAFLVGYSQVQNNGGSITVESGATLVIEGDYTSSGTGVIQIDGTVQLKGDFINNGGSISGTSTGLLKFNGTAAQEITGSAITTFCPVEVDNTNGIALTNTQVGNDQVLGSTMTLTNGDVTLNAFDLAMSSSGITGADASKHIVTNSTGALTAQVANTDFVFPVGDGTSYNPVILNEAGASDAYGVIYTGDLPGAFTGTDHVVDASWTITEATFGGSNLSVTAQWNGTQELSPFDETDCAVGVTTDNGATVAWKASGAAGGTDPYTRTGSGFTGVGTFMVGDYYYEGIEVDIDFLLAGPYNAGTGLMNTTLRTNNLIPLTDPYSLGTTVTSIPTNVVDWIKVELRDKNNAATILFSKAFFLDNTGNVLYTDGTSGARFTGVPKDQYFLAVKHRNHLGIRTNATIDLTSASPAFDFKSNTGVFQNQAYTPQYNLATGIYGLYKGNANGDAAVRKTGTPAISDYTAILNYLGTNLFLTNVYANTDVNMDAAVRKTGTPAISDYTHILNSCGSNLFILQQLP